VREIRPFTVRIAQAQLDELRDRLAHTRWPEEPPGVGWSSGAPLAEVKALVEYWRAEYDWREQEARLNELSHGITTIDGSDVHFIHVRSGEPDALPLMLAHGWPSTVAEFLDMIDPLTDPRAYGADPADAFHVVVPSIPGFGFSGPTRDVGWDSRRVARAFAELMERLGYQRYGAHGGDRGAMVARELGVQRPDRVIGVHVLHVFALPTGDPAELDGLSADDIAALEIADRWARERSGYAKVQSMRPQTLAYALTDSPAGQLAWYLDLYAGFGENAGALDPKHILTNATIHWLTGTAGSAARLYHEDARSGVGREQERSTVPTGVAVFARDDFRTIPSLAKLANRIVHWSEFDTGGHFAAMQAPDVLTTDLRTFFRGLR
jgi:epoxide hydrolase